MSIKHFFEVYSPKRMWWKIWLGLACFPMLPQHRAKLLKMGGGKIILTVGRFSYLGGYGKGFDILLKAMQVCTEEYTLYIVGDEPT